MHCLKQEALKLDITEGARLCGRLGMPQGEAAKLLPKEIVPFHLAPGMKEREGKWLHFFVDDYRFERVWNMPRRYLKLMMEFEGVIGVDFSMYADMPRAQQIWNCYRNRAMDYWLRKNGVNVIPTAGWSDRESLSWCFDGLPRHSVIAIETNGSARSRRQRLSLLLGFEKMCGILEPSAVVCYGSLIPELERLFRPVYFFESYSQMMRKRL
jgi:hypothetical protein